MACSNDFNGQMIRPRVLLRGFGAVLRHGIDQRRLISLGRIEVEAHNRIIELYPVDFVAVPSHDLADAFVLLGYRLQFPSQSSRKDQRVATVTIEPR